MCSVGLSSSDITAATVSPATLTFTSCSTGILEQTVTVTGVNDAVADGTQSYTIATAAAVSGDARLQRAGRRRRDRQRLLDHDAAGIIVDPASALTTSEAAGLGHTATFTVKLASEPTANASVGLNSSHITAGHGQSGDAHLHQQPTGILEQTVTVTGVNDAVAYGRRKLHHRHRRGRQR